MNTLEPGTPEFVMAVKVLETQVNDFVGFQTALKQMEDNTLSAEDAITQLRVKRDYYRAMESHLRTNLAFLLAKAKDAAAVEKKSKAKGAKNADR